MIVFTCIQIKLSIKDHVEAFDQEDLWDFLLKMSSILYKDNIQVNNDPELEDLTQSIDNFTFCVFDFYYTVMFFYFRKKYFTLNYDLVMFNYQRSNYLIKKTLSKWLPIKKKL